MKPNALRRRPEFMTLAQGSRLAIPFFIAAATGLAQLIPVGQPIPKTGKPPVVFVNGLQIGCTNSSFSSTFAIADQIVQANGEASVFFDNCTVPGSPSIEALGTALGTFLSGLTYTDGSHVDLVDVVAHSMGGLIVRSYLSGKQETEGAFNPPPAPPIRKILFLATPHFGSPVAALGSAFGPQFNELTSGSYFLFDLNTWNDNTDDLRGIDALAAIGNAGTGTAVAPGFDDGVVSLTSASLGFYMSGRTRVLPYCHVDGGGLISDAGLCPSNAKGIAVFRSASDPNSQLLLSFLNGTQGWQSIGQAVEQNSFLATGGGLYVRPFTSTGGYQHLNSATASAPGTSKNLNKPNDDVAYTDLFPAGSVTLTANADSGVITRTVTLPPTVYEAFIVKTGPNVSRVHPAAAGVFPLTVAPRMTVAIYGDALAAGTAQAQMVPLPQSLSDVQVTANGTVLDLYYASASQINAVLPDGISGLVKLAVQNGSGSTTVNLMVEPAHPAVFTLDATGTGAAAAVNLRTGTAVGAANPLLAGDVLVLFLTGLGATMPSGGYQVAVQTPTVTIDGQPCSLIYAGIAPSYPGIDQINCTVPAGLTANASAQLLVSSGGRTSNVTTVVVQ
jgi:uncharacterized protein (TIGR03437 family)